MLVFMGTHTDSPPALSRSQTSESQGEKKVSTAGYHRESMAFSVL